MPNEQTGFHMKLPAISEPAFRVTPDQIERARQLIKPHVLETAVIHSEPLSARAGRPVYLKCENSAALCKELLHSVEVVSEASIEEAIRILVHAHRLVVEGAAATGVAAILERKQMPGDGPLCVVLTGRNIDPQRLSAILHK